MNQYDFQPIPPEESAKVRRYLAIGAIAILVIILAGIFSGCAEQREQPELTGAWGSVTYPSNYYLFHSDGILEIHSIAAGQIVWEKWFAFEHNREIGALEVRDRNGLYFRGSVSFTPNADTAYIDQDNGLKITLAKW